MSLPTDFLASLAAPHPHEILAMVRDNSWPKGGFTIELRNEVRPVDLYCYLGARFGAPNGFQNFLRTNDSDNLIHWEWTLRHQLGLVSFQGMNFRTEVQVFGLADHDDAGRDQLVAQLKADFPANGARMGAIRQALEDWTEFVNPYQRIRRSVAQLLVDLDDLHLDPDRDRIDDHWMRADSVEMTARWEDAMQRYAKGMSLCFAIRSLLPVMAEAYINLILFFLMRAELRSDDRLRENAIRQPIDVRIKLLSVYCVGFERQPDYTSEACRNYHSLVNDRNDLLHGNVVVDKLKFNDVYFWGRVPVFREYRSMWQRSLDIQMRAVGLLSVRNELKIVDELIGYIESCLADPSREHVRAIARAFELGQNKKTGRLGILFPPHLADMRMQPLQPPKG